VGDHPVKVPEKLVEQWYQEAHNQPGSRCDYIADRAAQWGADQELEACCEWVGYPTGVRQLRAARRPKPPSLAEQALEQYEGVEDILRHHGCIPAGCIRAALNHLAELEAQQ
jgi:hypothetical protein